MGYVDGFVLVIKKKDVDAYRSLSRKAGKVFREHGALEYRECLADDVDVKFGIPFPKLVKAARGEVVIFAFVQYKSRAQRDRANAAIMKDKRMLKMMTAPMPFDCKRMSCGGFKVIVDA